MKTKVLKKTILHVCVLVMLNTILFSCTYPYFNQPQPVDAKNLKKVPRELWGAWINEKDSIIIDKYSFTHVVNSFDQSEISKSEMELSGRLSICKRQNILCWWCDVISCCM